MSVRVLAPGLLTTVQDSGRNGYRHLGVGQAGALDTHSCAIANLLAGNPIDAPALEITLSGPRLHFEQSTRIALCGADIAANVGDVAVAMWRPVTLPAGATLALGACQNGARTYLAIEGLSVPRVLGSASTDLRAGFGGIQGRGLIAGDVLQAGVHANVAKNEADAVAWWIDPTPDIDMRLPATVRVIAGNNDTAPPDALFLHPWRIAGASDRQGIRLEGKPLQACDTPERISEPIMPGSIQLPPDGQPIVLMADAQTHGGYPCIGHAIQADWPRLAQLRPGDALRFAPCTRNEAIAARRAQSQRLARIALAITSRTHKAQT